MDFIKQNFLGFLSIKYSKILFVTYSVTSSWLIAIAEQLNTFIDQCAINEPSVFFYESQNDPISVIT